MCSFLSTMENHPNARSQMSYTSSKFTNFPTEVLTTIFCQCSHKDLKQFALTCRRWNLVSRPLFFAKINLRCFEHFDKLIILIVKNKAIGTYVKYLECYSDISIQTLYIVSRLFKNLQELDVSFDDAVYKGLYDMLSVGEFPYLMKIPYPTTAFQQDLYTKCANAQIHRLTEIDLLDEDIFKRFCDKKPSGYPRLKYIGIQFDDTTPSSAMDIIEAVTQKNNMPSLKKISLHATGSGFRNNELSTNLDDVQPMLWKLSLEIAGLPQFIIIDGNFTSYMLKKFPNLHTLILMSSFETSSSTLGVENNTATSVDLTIKFLDYISKLRNFYVNNIATEEKTAIIIKKFCSNIEEESLKFTCLVIKYDRTPIEDNVAALRFPITAIQSASYFRDSDRRIIVTCSPLVNDGQRECELIKETGQFFTEMILENAPQALYGLILKHIARYCVNLKELVLEKCPMLPETEDPDEYNNTTVNNNLVKLELKLCDVCTEILPAISCLFPSLKFLSIYCQTTRYAPDRFISLEFPESSSIEHFQMEIEFYKKRNDETLNKIQGVCLELRVGEQRKHLLFGFVPIDENNLYSLKSTLQFERKLTNSEFDSMENDLQYCVCAIQCQSLKKFSFKLGRTINLIHDVYF